MNNFYYIDQVGNYIIEHDKIKKYFDYDIKKYENFINLIN